PCGSAGEERDQPAKNRHEPNGAQGCRRGERAIWTEHGLVERVVNPAQALRVLTGVDFPDPTAPCGRARTEVKVVERVKDHVGHKLPEPETTAGGDCAILHGATSPSACNPRGAPSPLDQVLIVVNAVNDRSRTDEDVVGAVDGDRHVVKISKGR